MQKVGICPTSIHLWRDCMRRLFRRRMAYCDQARRRMDEKNRSTRSGGPKVCCCAGEYRARTMACSVIFHAITIGYRRKGVSPIKGGGDTRAGGLFIPGRTLEWLIYCGPSRKLNLWRPTHVGGGLEYRFTPHIGIFGEIAYASPNLSNNNFIQTNFGLRFAFQAKN
jgi:hypothetical protein